MVKNAKSGDDRLAIAKKSKWRMIKNFIRKKRISILHIIIGMAIFFALYGFHRFTTSFFIDNPSNKRDTQFTSTHDFYAAEQMGCPKIRPRNLESYKDVLSYLYDTMKMQTSFQVGIGVLTNNYRYKFYEYYLRKQEAEENWKPLNKLYLFEDGLDSLATLEDNLNYSSVCVFYALRQIKRDLDQLSDREKNKTQTQIPSGWPVWEKPRSEKPEGEKLGDEPPKCIDSKNGFPTITDGTPTGLTSLYGLRYKKPISWQRDFNDWLKDQVANDSDRNKVVNALTSQIRSTRNFYEFHEGVDIDGKTGTHVVVALAGGKATNKTQSGYGNVVEVDHKNGFKTRYAHLDSFRTNANKYFLEYSVKKGDALGNLGNSKTISQTTPQSKNSEAVLYSQSANKTSTRDGSHLHIEVHFRGKKINPMPFLMVSLEECY